MTLEEMARQMLIDRGLGYDHTQPNQMDVPTSVQPDDAPQTLPWDYDANVKALDRALQWVDLRWRMGIQSGRDDVLQRARDFRVFLISKGTPEDGNDE